MNKKLLLLICFLGQFCFSQSKEYLQSMYLNYLKEQGYRPNIDNDGDVSFKAEGISYYIGVDEEDTEYFKISYATKLSSLLGGNKKKQLLMKFLLLNSLNEVNSGIKNIKIYLIKKAVILKCGSVVNRPEDFSAIFPRMLKMLKYAVKEFKREIEKLYDIDTSQLDTKTL